MPSQLTQGSAQGGRQGMDATDWTEQAALMVEGGPNEDEMIALGPTATLGWQPANDVVVPEAGVSRQHAQILESDDGYLLRDLASTNGTYVNQQRLSDQDYLLKDGDRIRLGSSKMSFVFRHSVADTLQLTLAQPSLEDTWEGEAGAEPADQSASKEKAAALAVDAPPEKEDLYEGTVRLNVRVTGGMGLVVNFVQQIRLRPELRMLRLANKRSGGVDVWVGIREPVSLRSILSEMDAVSEVSPTRGRDLSLGGQDPPLTVLLAAMDEDSATNDADSEPPANWEPCVSCKTPVEPDVITCPHCGYTPT